MFKSPRFLIANPSKKLLALHSNPNPKFATFETDTSMQDYEVLVQSFQFKSYGLVFGEVSKIEFELIKKIFNAINRTEIKILNTQNNETEFVMLQNSFNSKLDLIAFRTELSKVASKAELTVFLDFSPETIDTEAYILGTIVYLRTYALNIIAKNNLKKSEFWAFLKLLTS